MKLNSLTKFVVVSSAVLGIVVVATSQPGAVAKQQPGSFPEHAMIPDSVGLGQMQEFKDAATLHLNDIQKHMTGATSPQMRGKKTKFNETTIIHTSVFLDAINDTLVRYKEWSSSRVSVGSGPTRPLTPAEVATLYYVFDQGIDSLSTGGTTGAVGKGSKPPSPPSASATPDTITAKISPENMGMTGSQLKAMVTHYVEGHPMRFWNEARVGLASGR